METEFVVMSMSGMITAFMETNMTMFIVTMVFILLDIISGCVVGFITRTFSSTALRKGLGHKLGYIFIMCAVAFLQVAMFDPNFTLDFDFPLFNVVCGFIIFMEFVSVIENASKLNPNVDKIIGKYFDKSSDDDIVNLDTHFGADANDFVTAEFQDVVKGQFYEPDYVSAGDVDTPTENS